MTEACANCGSPTTEYTYDGEQYCSKPCVETAKRTRVDISDNIDWETSDLHEMYEARYNRQNREDAKSILAGIGWSGVAILSGVSWASMFPTTATQVIGGIAVTLIVFGYGGLAVDWVSSLVLGDSHD